MDDNEAGIPVEWERILTYFYYLKNIFYYFKEFPEILILNSFSFNF